MPGSHGQKIWQGRYRGSDGALAETHEQYRTWRRLRISNPENLPVGMKLASDYYSAAGNHFAVAKSALRQKMLVKAADFGSSGLIYLLRAHEIVSTLYIHQDQLPLELWDADQCDVAASVMYRCFRRRFASQLAAFGIAAYEREPERFKLHTLVFLKLHLARTSHPGLECLHLLQEIEQIAPKAAAHNKPQGSRIYRGLAEQYRNLGMTYRPGINRDRCFNKSAAYSLEAERLARESGATDQLIKIGVEP